MLSIDSYKIDLRVQPESLSETVHYVLDRDFFSRLDVCEIHDGRVEADVAVKGTMGVYRFTIRVKGSVTIQCDRCLDWMEQPVEAEHIVKVRIGDSYDETDDMLTLPADDGIFDLGWTMYEAIALALPIMRVHEEGECNAEMIEKLNEHRAYEPDDDENI